MKHTTRIANIDVLTLTTDQYDTLQRELLNEFGNEGADIGDAYDIIDLISNVTDDENDPFKHESYTRPEIHTAIATKMSTLINVPIDECLAFINRIAVLTADEYAALREKY